MEFPFLRTPHNRVRCYRRELTPSGAKDNVATVRGGVQLVGKRESGIKSPSPNRGFRHFWRPGPLARVCESIVTNMLITVGTEINTI